MWGFFPFWESWNPSSLNCSSLEQCHALLCGLMHSSYSLWQPLAAVSWDQCVLRLGQLELPALHISGSYLNISPYVCFTQKCQFQLWLKHPGKGVALCPCVLRQQGPGDGISVSSILSISEFQLCTSKCREPPKFYSSEIAAGCEVTG